MLLHKISQSLLAIKHCHKTKKKQTSIKQTCGTYIKITQKLNKHFKKPFFLQKIPLSSTLSPWTCLAELLVVVSPTYAKFLLCLLLLWWLLLVHCNNNFQDAPRIQQPFCACLMTGSTSAILVSGCNDLADVTWCMQLHFKSSVRSAPYARTENGECIWNMADVCMKFDGFSESYLCKMVLINIPR